MTGTIQAVNEACFRSLIKKIDILLWQRAWLCRGILMISRQPDMRRNARNALQESLRHRAMVQTLTPIGKRVLWAPCCLTMLLRGIQLGLSAEQETFTEVLRLWRDSMLKRYRDTIDQLTSDPSRHSVVGTLKRLQAET